MIRLVGPGGAGKSTAGAILAQRLGVSLIDLDEEFIANVGDLSLYIEEHGYDVETMRPISDVVDQLVAGIGTSVQ